MAGFAAAAQRLERAKLEALPLRRRFPQGRHEAVRVNLALELVELELVSVDVLEVKVDVVVLDVLEVFDCVQCE